MKLESILSLNNDLSASEALNLYLKKQFAHDTAAKYSVISQSRPITSLPKSRETADSVEARMSRYLCSQPYLSYKAVLLADAMYNAMRCNVEAKASYYDAPSDICFWQPLRPDISFYRDEKEDQMENNICQGLEHENRRFHIRDEVKSVSTSSRMRSPQCDYYRSGGTSSSRADSTSLSSIPYCAASSTASPTSHTKEDAALGTKECITSLLSDLQGLTRSHDFVKPRTTNSLMNRAQIAQVRRGVGILASLVDCDKCLNRCGSSNSTLLKLQRLNEHLRQQVAQLHSETESEVLDKNYNSKLLDRLLNEAELLVKRPIRL